MFEKYSDNFFKCLFAFIPISFLVGPSISLLNIILIDLSFILLIIIKRDFSFLKNKTVQLLFLFYLYLLFNSIISMDKSIGFNRNVGFFRLLILFIAFNYFFNKNNFFQKVFYFWILVMSVVAIDTFFESFTGKNILGYGEQYGKRIVSFFKDEPIVGAYLAGFIFLIFGYFLKESNKKIFAFMFLLIVFLAIIFTGERSNTIKVFSGIIIYFLLIDFLKIRAKFILILLFLTTFGAILSQSEFLKLRYIGQFYDVFVDKKRFEYLKDNNQYIKLYKSGYSVFKKYPFFGVGNKNYRVETCRNQNVSQPKLKYVCSTHPHQVYFELLSEHGLVGFILILSIFFFLMFKILKSILISRNYVQIGAFTFVLINFIPLLPSGSFFSDFNSTLFWINFSVMFACDKKTNIFAKDYV